MKSGKLAEYHERDLPFQRWIETPRSRIFDGVPIKALRRSSVREPFGLRALMLYGPTHANLATYL